ncbi:Uncharacterised protein [Vibrio cholerae]|uniref:Uncharacterized protein n=1 Tax=Vibrio cholerae TaxID=666 RepID=A0A655Z9H5_VIBCL|nr:Uncharacterised protein [Vibrio cholerae]CSA21743.1 Uncharacterised protein [Vibrio cholerae]CSA25420.1 Uncharacterised protein [Vibrio cholerae]CSA25528.1 Uncharacterised protein [Vibrio cholerae]CSA33999.1 Uncharacterised protein [Vibrio cholerae]
MPNASATVAKTGISRAALAVLLANSVKNTTKVATTRITTKIPIWETISLRALAKNTLVPVCFSTLLRQRPPPNSSNTPQSAVFWISFQCTTRAKLSIKIAPSATSVSKLLKPPSAALIGLLKIHKNTVKPKMPRVTTLPLSQLTGARSNSNMPLRVGFNRK